MDVFRFMNPAPPTKLDQGKLINGLKSKMWAERYREAGEFEFVAKVEKGAHLELPIGSLISHVDTTEVMMVENHEIIKDANSNPEVKITGRSFEAFLENRIVGSNEPWPTESSALYDYILDSDFSWNQIVKLIKANIDIAHTYDIDDALLNVETITTVTGVSEEVERSIKRGELYSRVLELINVDNLGIKTARPGIRSPLGGESQNLAIVVYAGEDLSSDVAFSYSTGEIESGDYLWSNKKVKNAALVTGRWIELTVKPISSGFGRSGYGRRMMYVDASDIDSSFSEMPVGSDRDNVYLAMNTKGRAALAAQKEIAFIKPEPAKNAILYKYRDNYEVGDIITVEGAYFDTSKMRIIEYVEIEDENGKTGYPTLEVI